MNPATAVLEALVHLEIRRPEALRGYRLLELELDPALAPETLDVEALPEDWRADLAHTRRRGDDWLASRASVALAVPSVIVPATVNVLLNPVHPQFDGVRLLHDHDFTWDARLFGTARMSPEA